MKPSRWTALRAIALAAALWTTACEMPWQTAGGSGTETSNGEIVVGRVYLGDGKPAAEADVYVRPADWVKDTVGIDSGKAPVPDAKTDKDGRFRLKALTLGAFVPGAYKAEVRRGSGLGLLVGFELKTLEGTLELSPDTLRPTGGLRGRAIPAPGASGPMYVQVYGLDRLVRTDDTGFFVIPELPAGPLRYRVLSNRTGISYAAPALAAIESGAFTEAAPLQPVTFANEDYAEWPFSRRIHVNTIAAGVTDTVRDFPLLVRLDANRFDFDLSDGKDIRFSTASGAHLAYQLDSWDAQARQAAFWVRLDTVPGNTRQTYFVMHYGRRDAPDFSDGKAVFSDFAGVWHFSEHVDADGEGAFLDASPSGSAGLAKVLPKDRLGAIGRGAGFKGTHRVTAPSTAAMRPASTVTLSAWTYIAGTGTQGGEFVSMGDNYGIRTKPDGDAHFFVFTDSTVTDPRWNPSNAFPATETKDLDLRGNWHHIVGRYDGTALKVFVDGMEQATAVQVNEIRYTFSRELTMGQHGNGYAPYGFTGSLDEVQLSPSVRSAAWIRLAYQTQRAGSTVLEFR